MVNETNVEYCKVSTSFCLHLISQLHVPSGGSRISPRLVRQLSGRAPTYDFAKISQKLHEIERISTPGGARPKFYYVDLPLVPLQPHTRLGIGLSWHEWGIMEGAKPFYSNSLNPNKRINGNIYDGVNLKSDTSHSYKLSVGNHNKYSNTIGTLNQIDQFENEHIP